MWRTAACLLAPPVLCATFALDFAFALSCEIAGLMMRYGRARQLISVTAESDGVVDVITGQSRLDYVKDGFGEPNSISQNQQRTRSACERLTV
jgi:hypothetical protein